MPSAPLPQSTPITCPNCGAALETKSALCPGCGARLEQTKPTFRSVVAAIDFALVLALMFLFGAVGACGAYFAVGVWPDRNRDMGGVVFFGAACCLVVGLVGFGLCLRALLRGKR